MQTILYIEDNLQNARLVMRMLDTKKYKVMEAQTGEVGLQIAREVVPGLILLDIHLPGINGAEVLEELRADPRLADIPVVIITADASISDRQKYLAAGCKAYLAKPVTANEVISTIESCVG
jgi:CheY-like chemotaxis protein